MFCRRLGQRVHLLFLGQRVSRIVSNRSREGEEREQQERKKTRTRRGGRKDKEEEGEERERQCGKQQVSALPFPLFPSSFIFLPAMTRSHPGDPSHGSFFVLSHSPRSGEHGLPYSAATTNDQLKQMTSTRVSSSSTFQPAA